jgi:hypothetical protein
MSGPHLTSGDENGPPIGTESKGSADARARFVSATPNPVFGSNRSIVIRYALPGPTHVQLSVYDISGRFVRELMDGDESRGEHVATWDGRNASGSDAPSGMYFYRLRAGLTKETMRMIISR